jgi:hypothetical protein
VQFPLLRPKPWFALSKIYVLYILYESRLSSEYDMISLLLFFFLISQSCSDVALFKQSITMIVLPLVASSMVLMHLNTLTYNHEVLIPYLDKVFDLHIDGKPVYSADEVREARLSFPY